MNIVRNKVETAEGADATEEHGFVDEDNEE